MRCVHNLTDLGPFLHLLFLCCHQPSWQQSHQHSWQQSHQHSWQQSLVTEGGFHTWMSSDSQLTRPLIHHAPKHGFSLSFLFSPALCAKPHLFM
ncbi:unnamed protein product, partial [Staurois parvus]